MTEVLPVTVAETARLGQEIVAEVERVIVGKPEAVRLVLLGVLASGYILIEDLPGLGKTLLARTFATVLGLEFTRVQFTPDMLPADLTGATVLDLATGEAVFRPGPVFNGLLLADEIELDPPKTQAGCLRRWQRAQPSADGTTWPLPQPSWCSPPTDPIQYEGTYRARGRAWTVTAGVRSATSGTPKGEAETVRRQARRGAPSRSRRRSLDAAGRWRCASRWRARSCTLELLGDAVALDRPRPHRSAGDGGARRAARWR